MSGPEICEVGGGGNVVPFFGDAEQRANKVIRGILYTCLLFWFFLGVSIIADIFMSGIEKITSQKKVKTLPSGRKVKVKVWNDTVANLTLMALGSSAPEILLSVLEIMLNDMYAGELGPSTVVGSAAFNLLVIIAVCISVIPTGESRCVKALEPYCVTASASVFAYAWLIVILAMPPSPNVITPAEGVLTFLFFPIVVVIAYLADIGVLSRKKSQNQSETAQQLVSLAEADGRKLSIDEAKVLVDAAAPEDGQKSKAKQKAEKAMNTGKIINEQKLSVGFKSTQYAVSKSEPAKAWIFKTGSDAIGSRVGLEIAVSAQMKDLLATQTMTSERRDSQCLFNPNSSGKHYVEIPAGQKEMCFEVPVPESKSGNAVGSPQDPEAPESMVVLVDIVRSVLLKVPDHKKLAAKSGSSLVDGVSSASTSFLTNSVQANLANGAASTPLASQGLPKLDRGRSGTLGKKGRQSLEEEMSTLGLGRIQPYGAHRKRMRTTKLQLVDKKANDRGVLGFESDEVVLPSFGVDTTVNILVTRKGGTNGDVKCHFAAEADTAQEMWDYVLAPGTCMVTDCAKDGIIEVLVKAQTDAESKERFFLHLTDHPDFPNAVDPQRRSCTVTILDANSPQALAERIRPLTHGESTLDENDGDDHLSWKEQFIMALRPVCGDEDEAAEAHAADWALHFISLPWKLLFASVPPTQYCGGWACFFVALIFVGILTMFIGDIANMLGCVAGISSQISGITIVALGTSLPDTFASMSAAVDDPSADAAVGNVTGSNAVNVFLGLGLPWMIASIYWVSITPPSKWFEKYPSSITNEYPDGAFVVMAGDLVFSVCIFTTCAISAIISLAVRRMKLGAELGGPTVAKYNTSIFFVCLWLYYVGCASWKIIQGEASNIAMIGAALAGLMIMLSSFVFISGSAALYRKIKGSREKEISDMAREATGTMKFRSLREAAQHMRKQIEVLSIKAAELEAQAERIEMQGSSMPFLANANSRDPEKYVAPVASDEAGTKIRRRSQEASNRDPEKQRPTPVEKPTPVETYAVTASDEAQGGGGPIDEQPQDQPEMAQT